MMVKKKEVGKNEGYYNMQLRQQLSIYLQQKQGNTSHLTDYKFISDW